MKNQNYFNFKIIYMIESLYIIILQKTNNTMHFNQKKKKYLL